MSCRFSPSWRYRTPPGWGWPAATASPAPPSGQTMIVTGKRHLKGQRDKNVDKRRRGNLHVTNCCCSGEEKQNKTNEHKRNTTNTVSVFGANRTDPQCTTHPD